MSEMVTLTLAHPLSAKQADRLHASESRDYNIDDKITVPVEDARAIINSGFAAGVDPEQHDQVTAALHPAKASAKKTATT